jgi:hypothetical protein
MYYATPSLPTTRQAEAITLPMETVTRPYHVTHLSVSGPISELDAGAITLIDGDALQAAADAVRDYLERYAASPIVSTPRDYARQLPALGVLSQATYTDCPECEGTGVLLFGTLAPDDFIEERCALCLGTGMLDIADAPTVELSAIAVRLNWPAMPPWPQVVTP